MIAVLLVGGLGTRLRPLTLTTPKAMLPVANRPFLEHQLDHLAAHGIDRVILACGYEPQSIREHFGDRLEYVVEDEPLGTGGAIAHAARGIDEPFLACNGDVLTDLDLTALIEFHASRDARATIALHAVADPSRYGVVVTEPNGRVTAFVEKPEGEPPASTINAGTYVLTPETLERVPPGRAVSIEREVFPELVGHGLYASAEPARWIDIGTPESYLEANLIGIGPDGLIDPSAVIGAGAQISRSVIGDHAQIGAGAVVSGSVVLPDGRVPPGAIVENAVISTEGPVW
jgi:NDP-sugar pyrophosphorylase family protein